MEATADLTVEITLAPKDVCTPFEWSRANVTRWLTAIIGVYLAYEILLSPRKHFRSYPGESYVSLLVIAAVIVVCAGFVFYPYLQVRPMFRLWPKMQLPVKAIFLTERLLFEFEDGCCDLKWSAFPQIIETRTVFQFILSGGAIFHVPKRCFASPQEVTLLRQLIRDNFKGKVTLPRQ